MSSRFFVCLVCNLECGFFHLEQHLRHDFQCDECYFFCGIVYLESDFFCGFQCSERHPIGGI